jgi:NADP-dependent 3-hydroxy acid dehydrogenase YdfG
MGLELKDRVAIVTGAAQGIGEATARKLAERGATVVGIDILADRLSQVMGRLPNAVAMTMDVTNAEADQRAVQDVYRRYGRVDILVNVAGGVMGAPAGVDRLSIQDWHRVLDLNLHAP